MLLCVSGLHLSVVADEVERSLVCQTLSQLPDLSEYLSSYRGFWEEDSHGSFPHQLLGCGLEMQSS